MLEKIISLKLYFEKPHTEKQLSDKGFLKIENERVKYTYYNLEKDGLYLLYLIKNYNDISYGELTIYIKEDKIMMYKDAKEFNIFDSFEILKEINIIECNSFEIYGKGDIRKELIQQDYRWNEPSWLKGSLLYINEYSGISYHQEDGFYRMCYDGEDKINIIEAV